MKKTYFLALALMFSYFCLAGEITRTYHFDNPAIQHVNSYQLLSFESTFPTGVTGEPVLPYQDIRLLLPPGEEAVGINYQFEGEVSLSGQYTLYPQQSSRPLSQGASGLFQQNEELYSSQGIYPAEKAGQYATHFMNGHSILLSSFTPVQYVPSTGKIIYFSSVTVTVTTAKTQRAQGALQNLSSSGKRPAVMNLIQNPEMAKAYPEKSLRDEAYPILVITPQQFAAAFEGYRALYHERGMESQVATIEDISASSPGNDLQEKIRNFIIQEYQDNGVEFVLLGGDVEHVPYRGFYCYVQSGSGYEDYDIPADLYYSALDGTWNDNGDNKWGEIGEDDLLPDVSVARWPFSTATQLDRLIHKATFYQDFPVTGELQRPLLAGEYLWSDPETWGGDYLDLLIGHHEDNGYTTDGIPDSDDILKLYDRDGGWNAGDLIDAVNQGRNFIHHSGHANQTYVMKLGIYDITNENFSGANGVDHNYTLVYSHGCLCGAFDDSDCIGEAMVLIDNFAVAGAFNSRYGWFNEGQTEGPSHHMHREFVDALYDQQENRIGKTHLISKVNTSPWVNAPGQHEEGALRWCFYACNILGDPALAVWTQEPMAIDVQYPGELVQGATSFTVTVNSNGNPAEGMMCVIMVQDEMAGCCATDATGTAVIQIPGGFSGDEAELVVSGYHCQPRHYPVNVQVGLDAPAGDPGLSIYPVPFTDELHMELIANGEDNVVVQLLLTDGRIVDQFSAGPGQGTNSFIRDASGWPAGIIIMKMTSNNKLITRKLLHLNK